VVSKGREAHLICWNLLTVINPSPYRARASRPVCAAKERNLFIEAQLGQEKKVALSRNAICTAVRISKPRRGKTTEEKQPIKPAKPQLVAIFQSRPSAAMYYLQGKSFTASRPVNSSLRWHSVR